MQEHGCPSANAALLHAQVEAAVARHRGYFDVQLAVTPVAAADAGELAICWCVCLKQRVDLTCIPQGVMERLPCAHIQESSTVEIGCECGAWLSNAFA